MDLRARNTALALGACLLLFASGDAQARAKGRLSVTKLDGNAEVLRSWAKAGAKAPADDARWKKLKVGSKIATGDAVRTSAKSRLELSLKDGSKLRLGAKSKMTVTSALFGKTPQDRQVRVKMWLGRIWAKVAKQLAGEASFEVETQNAVAGVRGTSFTVVASADLSAVVRVYSGTVGVRKAIAKKVVQDAASSFKSRRTEVPGPSRIDRQQWEEYIATAMKQIKISALGDLAPAEDFEDAGAELEWASWNQGLD